jgi:hypothetical protein
VPDGDRIARVRARDAGLRRLRTATRLTALGATVLAGAIALLTAATAPAKRIVRVLPATPRTHHARVRTARPRRRVASVRHAHVRRTHMIRHAVQPTPKPVVHKTVTVQAPPQPPVQTHAQPVVVSGGS